MASPRENEIFKLVFNRPAKYYSSEGEFTSEDVRVILYMSMNPKNTCHKIKVEKGNKVYIYYTM